MKEGIQGVRGPKMDQNVEDEEEDIVSPLISLYSFLHCSLHSEMALLRFPFCCFSPLLSSHLPWVFTLFLFHTAISIYGLCAHPQDGSRRFLKLYLPAWHLPRRQ
jgi:hypothetical protein